MNNKKFTMNLNFENKYIKPVYMNENEQFFTVEELRQKYLEMQIKLKLTHGKPSPWLHYYHE